ncbi:MAG: hypothetical protein U0231_00605 [Nitrospiraceae bacterium]
MASHPGGGDAGAGPTSSWSIDAAYPGWISGCDAAGPSYRHAEASNTSGYHRTPPAPPVVAPPAPSEPVHPYNLDSLVRERERTERDMEDMMRDMRDRLRGR